jgi:hypothetical protein
MRPRSFWRRYVLHNFGLKVVSLLLSIFLWLGIASGRLR